MATKKFLDLDGLKIYNGKIKAYADNAAKTEASKVDTAIRKDYKVKNVDTTVNDKVSLTLNENGVVGVTVNAAVVKDSEYSTVKANANNSAAAWGKFLEGTTDLYPNNVTPGLKDLATKQDVADAKEAIIGTVDDTKNSDTIKGAKKYADSLADNYAAAHHTHAIADVTGLQTALDGKAAIDHNHDTVYSKLGHNHDDAYDAKGDAAQALKDAKAYTDSKVDGKFDALGSAEAAKTAAISAAKTYTDDEIKKVDDQIKAINTSIAGGVHFIGISTSEITDKGTQIPTITGWTGPVKTGDIVINNAGAEFIWDGSKWQKLGDTTAELERISALEGDVDILRGTDNVEGSVAKALKDAKAFTTGEINTLVGPTGQVGKNKAAIDILNGTETTTGSVKKALADAKAYTDTAKKAATDYTDTKIDELVGETGQVGINTAAITKLNGGKDVVGSVDYKIAQAVSNIEASIDTITEADINALFV